MTSSSFPSSRSRHRSNKRKQTLSKRRRLIAQSAPFLFGWFPDHQECSPLAQPVYLLEVNFCSSERIELATDVRALLSAEAVTSQLIGKAFIRNRAVQAIPWWNTANVPSSVLTVSQVLLFILLQTVPLPTVAIISKMWRARPPGRDRTLTPITPDRFWKIPARRWPQRKP